MQKKSKIEGKMSLIVLGICTVLSILWHWNFSQTLQYPLVPTDEWSYKSMAFSYFFKGDFYQYTPNFPGVLYQWMISWFFSFGNVFFPVVKIFNILLMHSMIIPVYLLARQFLSKRWSACASGLLLLLPQMYYAHFLMIESLYFPLFLCTCFFIIKGFCVHQVKWDIMTGVILALLLHTKLNGLAVLLSFILTALTLTGIGYWIKEFSWEYKKIFMKCIVVLSSLVLSYVILSLLLKGKIDISLGLYAGYVKPLAEVYATPMEIVSLVRDHLSLIFLYYALPVMIICLGLKGAILKREREAVIFGVFVVACSLVVFIMVTKFMIDISWLEQLSRIHARYVTMLYPLFILSFFIFLPRCSFQWKERLFMSLLLGVAVYMALVYALPKYGVQGLVFVDNVDISWFLFLDKTWISGVLILVALQLISILVSTKKQLLLTYPFMLILLLGIAQWGQVQGMRYSDYLISKGPAQPTKMLAQKLEHSDGTIMIADDSIVMGRTLAYWMNKNEVIFYQNENNKSITLDDIPKEVTTIVTMAPYLTKFPINKSERFGPIEVITSYVRE